MRIPSVLIAAVLTAGMIFFSCAKRSDMVKKENLLAGSYRFNYAPYDAIAVQDRPLYNYLFNIIRNKLVYYVQKTLPSVPEPVGLVMEMQTAGDIRCPDGAGSKAVRGWTVFDSDVIPLPDEDVAGYNSGSFGRKSVETPKACFAVACSGNTATVSVSYWILQYYTYRFVHTLSKTSNWSMVRTDSLD